MQSKSYRNLFFGNIDFSIKSALGFLKDYPASFSSFLRIAERVKSSEKIREKYSGENLEIPPLMIVSTTEVCNLKCAGCYACEKKKESEKLGDNRINEVLNEASDIGVNIVMLAGGEPLMEPQWLYKLGEHPEFLGILFTNGTLLTEKYIKYFDAHRHIIPVISVEGNETQTDKRRGAGIYAKITAAIERLKNERIPCGISVTVTSENFGTVTNSDFINKYISMGVKLFIFTEYVPVEKGSEPLVLSAENKRKLTLVCEENNKNYPAWFVPFPGNEENYGGCLAAGRGFIHISSSGKVEPCPFAPFSDTSLKDKSLVQALSSPLLRMVRENHHLLKESDGGCALWHNKELLSSMISEKQ